MENTTTDSANDSNVDVDITPDAIRKKILRRCSATEYDLTQLGIRIQTDVYNSFKEQASKRRMSIALLLEECMKEFMSYGKGGGGKGGGKGGGGKKK